MKENRDNTKTCPFCGFINTHSPLLITEKECLHEGNLREYKLWHKYVCLKCKMETRAFRDKEDLFKFWNNREQ